MRRRRRQLYLMKVAEKSKGPGLKALQIRAIQGPKGPCSLRFTYLQLKY
jgi:hypothetical protein